MKTFLLCLLCLGSMLHAKNFGKRGHLFPIEEENLADYFRRAVSQNAENYLAGMRDQIQRPDGPGLPMATEERSYLVELPGPFTMGMLFIDGDDPRQIKWAQAQEGSHLWMLVNGSPTEVEQRTGREVFFDQMGFYTSHLKIEHTPAIASPEDGKARVKEIALKENL